MLLGGNSYIIDILKDLNHLKCSVRCNQVAFTVFILNESEGGANAVLDITTWLTAVGEFLTGIQKCQLWSFLVYYWGYIPIIIYNPGIFVGIYLRHCSFDKGEFWF